MGSGSLALISDFLKDLEPLNPGHAFYSGRTGGACLYHKTEKTKGEKAHYTDVISEYPWVNKYGTYPVGHPKIFANPESCDVSEYYGLAKIDIPLPTELFNLILPYRSGGN